MESDIKMILDSGRNRCEICEGQVELARDKKRLPHWKDSDGGWCPETPLPKSA